jgi:hypothetical protein
MDHFTNKPFNNKIILLYTINFGLNPIYKSSFSRHYSSDAVEMSFSSNKVLKLIGYATEFLALRPIRSVLKRSELVENDGLEVINKRGIKNKRDQKKILTMFSDYNNLVEQSYKRLPSKIFYSRVMRNKAQKYLSLTIPGLRKKNKNNRELNNDLATLFLAFTVYFKHHHYLCFSDKMYFLRSEMY